MQAFAISKRYLKTRAKVRSRETISDLALGVQPSRLSPPEKKFARIAWTYFKRGTDAASGFCPERAQSQVLGPYQMGAMLLAILCAYRLGLLSKDEAHERMSTCLRSISAMELTENSLPFACYCAKTMRPTKAPPALPKVAAAREIMRLVAAFIAVSHHHPDLAPELSMTLNSWNLEQLVKGENFIGMKGSQNFDVRGGLGYEHYAARAGDLVGLPCQRSLDVRCNLTSHHWGKIELPADRRHSPAHPCIITSDPFQLEALEFGWRQEILDVAASLFLAQKSRFEQTAILTALSEVAIDALPKRAIQGIVLSDQPFQSLSTDGQDLSKWHCLSTGAAFGWWALMPSPYSQKLVDALDNLATRNGWQAGIYEANGQANTVLSLDTNAHVLEALHYKAFGPLFPTGRLT